MPLVRIEPGKFLMGCSSRGAIPANSVHWLGAAKYCEWLSIKTRKSVRLPTEAEWEFTARGTEGRKSPWGEKSVDNWSSIEGSEVDASKTGWKQDDNSS